MPRGGRMEPTSSSIARSISSVLARIFGFLPAALLALPAQRFEHRIDLGRRVDAPADRDHVCGRLIRPALLVEPGRCVAGELGLLALALLGIAVNAGHHLV